MNYNGLITAVQDRCGLSKSQASAAVFTVMEQITESLAQGEPARFAGFGSFEILDKQARTGRNPQTGASIKIPAKTTVKFRAGSKLKDAVNAA